MAQDLPGLDKELTQLPEDILKGVAEKGRNDLWFFSKAILKNRDLTPGLHGPLCVFLDSHPARFKMVQLPRGHFKTTVATISRNLQKVCQDPNNRILLLNETSSNAEDFLGAIKQHVETNPIFRTLYSDIIPSDTRRTGGWSGQELLFNRTWVGPAPTLKAMGMTGALTSQKFTHISIDDPISEDAVQSENVMKNAIIRISKVLELMSDPRKDTFDIIGTRWAFHDIYSAIQEQYGSSLALHIRSAIENGKPIFPERFSLEFLAQRRKALGEYAYSCNYMNTPRDEKLQDFNVNDLRFWYYLPGGELALINPHTKEPSIVDFNRLDVVITVDLAVAEKLSSDRNAVVVSATTPEGDVVVLEAWAARCPPDQVMETIFRFAKKYQARIVGVESVAYQKVFAYMLAQEALRRNEYLNIEPLPAKGKKEMRVRGLQPVAALGHLYLNAQQHELRDEFAAFPLGKHDDLVDALAYGLQLWRGTRTSASWLASQKQVDKMLRRIEGYNIRPEGEDEDDDPKWQDSHIETGHWVL